MVAETAYDAKGLEFVAERRVLLARLPATGLCEIGPYLHNLERPILGIGFSGGGIRAATISLGAIQALAKAKRLLDFDYMSSVSGGGYIASFLGSLFVPTSARDAIPDKRDPALAPESQAENTALDLALAQRRDFALQALIQPSDRMVINAPAGAPGPVHSPVQWLRENGRYLAPNGATDYATAATYLSRNWLAMIYCFMIAMAGALFAFQAVLSWVIYQVLDAPHATWLLSLIRFDHAGTVVFISPILLLVPVLLLLGVSSGVAYWLTNFLHGHGPQRLRPIVERHPRFALVAAALLVTAGARSWALHVSRWYATMAGHSCAATGADQPAWDAGMVPLAIAGLGVVIALGAAFFALCAAWSKANNGVRFFVADARRNLTLWTTKFNLTLLVVLALGVIDTLGLWLHHALLIKHGVAGLQTAAWAALAPVAAWIIHLISSQSDSKGVLSRIFSSYLNEVALLAGLLLFGGLAVLSDVLVHFNIWRAFAWPALISPVLSQGWSGAVDVQAMKLDGPALGVLVVVTGFSTGFINLSSLHNFYATRLTRTYLGAANTTRLWELENPGPDGNIRDSQPQDDIDICRYQAIRTPAPLHLINVTLNETGGSDNSPLVDRDRKGLSLVFAPEGVVLNAGPQSRTTYTWSKVTQGPAEPLSLGQLCAISGAAVSTGMGANTSIGLALCLTFANARLGYWWQSRRLLTADKATHRNWLGAYGYLLREMLASFRRDTDRVCLSDGGHFENSGAYELLQRPVQVMLVLDNGADPDYSFADLENLVRKARLDMGLNLTVADSDAVETHFGQCGAKLFFNDKADGWRIATRDLGNTAFALLIKVTGTDVTVAQPRWIVWIKPRLVAGNAIDVHGYGLAHPTFPQESTANQFFDEAQWESYRALGEYAISTLFGQEHGADALRKLAIAGAP